jgi:hypothetical protein
MNIINRFLLLASMLPHKRGHVVINLSLLINARLARVAAKLVFYSATQQPPIDLKLPKTILLNADIVVIA